MDVVFHTGKESEKPLREFAEKRAEFLSRELQNLNAEELKVLLSALKGENRTFEQKKRCFYNKRAMGWRYHHSRKEELLI